MRSVARGAAAHIAALIFAKSLCAVFGHRAMYASTPVFFRFGKAAVSRRRSVFLIESDGRDFSRDSQIIAEPER